MHDLDMHAALLRDLDGLGDRFHHFVRFVAQVGEIPGIVALEHMAERDHLRGLRVRAGRREQPRGQSERAGFERVFEERDHLQQTRPPLGARSAMPITIRRSVLWPTSMPAFTAIGGKFCR